MCTETVKYAVPLCKNNKSSACFPLICDGTMASIVNGNHDTNVNRALIGSTKNENKKFAKL